MPYEIVKSLRDALIAYGINHAKAAEMASVMAGYGPTGNTTQEALYAATRQLVEAYQSDVAATHSRAA